MDVENRNKLNTTSSEEQPANSTGAQGVDKDPGEDSASGTKDLLRQSQKGKKVDADLTQAEDQPLPVR